MFNVFYKLFHRYFKQRCSKNFAWVEYATVLYCVIEAIVFFVFFSKKVSIVKLVSVDEDFVSAVIRF